ncbi:MAG: gliding motility-associated C-terminal domain-containing protein [Flavobacteriales bacterium]|nr:gliding motility-associated C-terminal domain-containing protein [Flavobacteriales bacterium]
MERPATRTQDCAGVWGGTAVLDNCGTCVGGTTGNTACTQDCAGVWGGTAVTDNCGTCVGGTTGNIACTQDCAGVWGGTAVLDNCGTCVGGTTGNVACTQDCAGVWGGTAVLDNCGTCVGGTTGNTACTQDCAGVWGGTAVLDNCGTCVGGTTGNVACTQDCAGVWGGTAVTDNCATCVGGTTGNVACTQDCAGVWGGTAVTDNCGTCVGGTTGNTACTQDCAGVWGGTAVTDNCGTCVGGTTGNTACTQDCAGVWGGTSMPPVAGDDGSATICAGTSIDLTTLLSGADTGGVWSVGPVVSSTGTFTYTVTNACGSDESSFTITHEALADASWSIPPAICETAPPLVLSNLITGDQGGTWSGAGVLGSSFDPTGLVGPIQVTYTVGTANCISQESHTIQVGQMPMADAGEDAIFCGTDGLVNAVLTTGSGSWTLPNGLNPGGALTAPDLELHASTFASYTLYWTVTDGPCIAQDATEVTFMNPDLGLAVDAGPDQYLEVLSTAIMQGHATPGATIEWWLLSGGGTLLVPSDTNSTVQDLALGDNYFVLTVSLGQCASISDTVLLHVDDLFIPEGYSPNGDGVNDRWEITGISAFPGSSLKVFNRWGQLVYESDSYNNEWDGHALYGRELPDATYFYVLNLSSDRTYNGHVILKR